MTATTTIVDGLASLAMSWMSWMPATIVDEHHRVAEAATIVDELDTTRSMSVEPLSRHWMRADASLVWPWPLRDPSDEQNLVGPWGAGQEGGDCHLSLWGQGLRCPRLFWLLPRVTCRDCCQYVSLEGSGRLGVSADSCRLSKQLR